MSRSSFRSLPVFWASLLALALAGCATPSQTSAEDPGATPEGGATKTGAGPAIWSDAAGFKAEAVKFTTDAKAAGASKDAASFAAALKTVQADCGGCHKTYRVTAH